MNLPHYDESTPHSFTYSYSQPTQYRFCRDSVLFPKFVASQMTSSRLRVLDVCAGSGVIGFEVAYYQRDKIDSADFLELQSVFRSHFEENLVITGSDPSRYRFVEAPYRVLLNPEYEERYDLIIGNPPYFFAEDGKLSQNEVRNNCRFFLQDDLQTLVKGCLNALAPGGQAFLLVKLGETHGRNTFEDLVTWTGGRVERVARVRTTDVVRISKTDR